MPPGSVRFDVEDGVSAPGSGTVTSPPNIGDVSVKTIRLDDKSVSVVTDSFHFDFLLMTFNLFERIFFFFLHKWKDNGKETEAKVLAHMDNQFKLFHRYKLIL